MITQNIYFITELLLFGFQIGFLNLVKEHIVCIDFLHKATAVNSVLYSTRFHLLENLFWTSIIIYEFRVLLYDVIFIKIL